MTVLFEYDSRHTATRLQVVWPDARCQWLRVVKKRPESGVFDVGRGETRVIKGHAEVSGQVATRHPPPGVFDLHVEPESSPAFRVTDCQVAIDYGGYGEDTRIYDFVAKGLDLESRPRSRAVSHVVECNCDQALLYLAMIGALVATASDELRRRALDTVGRWERDHPDVDLAARLKTLEDK
jgi:hypothetical protein